MPHTTIVGAGQAGLQLGLALLQHDYQVTLVSDRRPEEIRNGAILSTQVLFGPSREIERELGLELWPEAPPIEGVALQVAGPDGNKALEWSARFDAPAQSVDQRLKIPEWMRLFEARGGELRYAKATLQDLEDYASTSDLVIVAAGKGEISQLFARDAEKSKFDQPQRALAVCYVRNMKPRPSHSAVVFNVIPGAGEYFVMPGLTLNGPCEQMFFEGLPGGPFDCFQEVHSSEEHLALAKRLLDQFVPWEAERSGDVELTDDRASLRGRFAPTVRKPVGQLPSGACVLGMADTIVLNDPITGQGANNAVKSADLYLQQILERGERPFDAAWMQETFALYWDYAQWVTAFTNTMLLPPTPHFLKILGAAAQQPRIAHRFVNAFSNPREFFPWLTDPVEAERFIAEYSVKK
jgi:hypothetical protein